MDDITYQRALKDFDAGKIFVVYKDEWPKAQDFIKQHNELHKGQHQGAIGGRYTYTFTSTSIGQIITLVCACGGKVDLSGEL